MAMSVSSEWMQKVILSDREGLLQEYISLLNILLLSSITLVRWKYNSSCKESSVMLVQFSPRAGRRTCVLLCHRNADTDGRLPSLCISQFSMSEGNKVKPRCCPGSSELVQCNVWSILAVCLIEEKGRSKINFGWYCSLPLVYLMVTHSCLHMKNTCQPNS